MLTENNVNKQNNEQKKKKVLISESQLSTVCLING